MTTQEKINYLKNGVYKHWIKPNKKSLFKKECHICECTIKNDTFYKVKVYDKHSRRNYIIELCNEHGRDLII